MNSTLQRFNYPSAMVKEFDHWIVLIRPDQITPFSCIIAANADVSSLGELNHLAGAELPLVIRGFEAAVKRIAPAVKFNYLALMMVDPNPHFHAIPRYAAPFTIDSANYCDIDFPWPANVAHRLDVGAKTLERWRDVLSTHW